MDRSYQKQQEGRDTQLFLKCSVKVNTTTSLNFQGLFKYRASFSLIFKDLKRGFPNSRTLGTPNDCAVYGLHQKLSILKNHIMLKLLGGFN